MRLTYTQESDFRQQRDFGQKFSATFEFIGAHWRGLGRALLYIVLPAALLQGIISAFMQKQLLTTGVHDARLSNGGMLQQMAVFNNLRQSPYYWVSVVTGGIFVVLLFLTVYSYLRCCLRTRSAYEPITVSEVWAGVQEEFISSFVSYYGLLILVIIGFALLFVPGMYLAIAFSLFYAVKVMEGSGFGATCRRCLTLVRGKWWSTFGLLFIMSLVLGIAMAVVGGIVGGIVYGAARGALGSSSAEFGDANSPLGLFTIITTAFAGLLNLLIYPPMLIALAFQYFNLVERHDGVGLRNMVSQLGQAPAAVQNAAYRPDDEGEY